MPPNRGAIWLRTHGALKRTMLEVAHKGQVRVRSIQKSTTHSQSTKSYLSKCVRIQYTQDTVQDPVAIWPKGSRWSIYATFTTHSILPKRWALSEGSHERHYRLAKPDHFLA